MESRELNILKLLEAIKAKPSQSQRNLAEKMNLSLGMVNQLIKEMTSHGFIQPGKLVGNKIKYSITKSGVVKRRGLKNKHLSQHIDCYNELRQIVKQGLKQFEGMSQKRILFYGTIELCEIACMLFGHDNQNYIIIIDNENTGRKINNYSIQPESEIENMAYDAVLILALEKTKQARTKLIDMGIASSKIYQVIEPGENDNLKN